MWAGTCKGLAAAGGMREGNLPPMSLMYAAPNPKLTLKLLMVPVCALEACSPSSRDHDARHCMRILSSWWYGARETCHC